MQHPETNVFMRTCNQIFQDFPEAIGVAYKGLDCGCSLMCGVSAQGYPVGELQHVAGASGESGADALVCLACKRDDGLQRVVNQGIMWPGTRAEWPDPSLRLKIGKAVFGPAYEE